MSIDGITSQIFRSIIPIINNKMKSQRPPISYYLRKYWLLIGILLCIFSAGSYPKLGSKSGPLNTDYTVRYGAVTLIFLISGLTLRTDSIYDTFRHYRLHLFIQLFTFLGIPLFTQLFVRLLATVGINAWILKGLITVSCMPPPVSSAVILTRAAHGNETAAILNSILGSFLGIIITPLALLFHLGSTTIVPLFGTIVQLTVTVLAPLIIGQCLRNRCQTTITRRLPLTTIGQCALLFVIYATFCDAFDGDGTGLNAADILFTVFAVLLMQLILVALSWSMATSEWLAMLIARNGTARFTIEDAVAIVFCSTHKSLTLGIPILKIMFHGYSHLSQISLPLLVYHPMQIILGGLMVSQFKDMVLGQDKMGRRRPPV